MISGDTPSTLLLITVIACLLCNNKKISYALIASISALWFHQGLASLIGLLGFVVLGTFVHIYFNQKSIRRSLRFVFFLIIFALVSGFIYHLIPGFLNPIILDSIKVSEISSSFSIYLNFDKVIAALIILVAGNLIVLEKKIDIESIKKTTLYLSICVAVILSPSLISGYIKFDPKLPNNLGIWAVNNLFFVCLSEEVIFRGFVQKEIQAFIKTTKSLPYIHIVISSIIFGLFHFRGGYLYIILSTIAGLFYGYTYHKTARITCAILIHFGLNLCHFILFTYPAAL